MQRHSRYQVLNRRNSASIRRVRNAELAGFEHDRFKEKEKTIRVNSERKPFELFLQHEASL